MADSTITLYESEQFGGSRKVRYQKIRTQLYELILTTI